MDLTGKIIKREAGQARSGQAVPDPGRIPAQLASQPARGGDEAVRRLGRWIGRRSTAGGRRPRRPFACAGEASLGLGFDGAAAYRGRRG
jgi:hypothetical protein